MRKLIYAASAALLCTGAGAQEFYAGASLDYMLPHSGDSQTVGTLIGGVAVLSTDRYSFGAELELGQRIAGDNDYDTQRYRLWGSYPLGQVAARGSIGITQYDFDGTRAEGAHIGLGVETDVSDRVTLRGEFIRDFMDDAFTDAVTTSRIGVFYNF